jgi:L-alanine-DL-glutamate epimerase-like enolase superfamily enzyme
MKVSRLETKALSVPVDYPLNRMRQRINLVLVTLTSEEGLEGFGICFAQYENQVHSLKASVDSLSEVIVGQDVFRWAEAWEKMYSATTHMGHSGHGIYALSAIDTALWVLMAKSLDIPLAHLLGGSQEKVPVYASHLLWRDWSIDELQKDAASLVSQGFKAMKMRMGDKPFKEELERLRAVREAVGEDINIMVDINWRWTATDTIRMGREFEKYNVYWLEDPLASDDPQQLAQVASVLDMPITIGETYCTKYAFRNLIEKRSGDIFMIDLERVGGITEWVKVAAMAQAWNIPVASHQFPDFSLHLVAAVPNGLTLEYLPWWKNIYRDFYQVVDGYIEVPQVAGLGLELDTDAIDSYQLK